MTTALSFNDLTLAIGRMRTVAECVGRTPRHLWLGPDACAAVSERMDELEAAGMTKPNVTGETTIMGLVWVPMNADGVALAFDS